jgi:hypothetical protein
MSAGTQEYMQKNFRNGNSCNKFFIIHNSGPQGYIHLQKTLGHIHNNHILIPRVNSSYVCHEFKIQDRRGP